MTDRNFNNFHLGDNVHQLADGLIPEIAERLGIDLDSEPNAESLGGLIGALGKNKVLRDNDEVTAIDRDTAVDFLDRSGVQSALRRSLWTLGFDEHNDIYGEWYVEVDAVSVVATGGVANWQDRTARLMADEASKQLISVPTYLVAGPRIMNSATEVNNPNVLRFTKDFGRAPSEADYASTIVARELINVDDTMMVLPQSFGRGDGDVIAEQFFERNPQLLDQRLIFARVANAGVMLAVQMRLAAQKQKSEFDTDPTSPQVMILTDEFSIARTEEQEKDPANYQKAITGLRQVAVTAKMLHIAAGGE